MRKHLIDCDTVAVAGNISSARETTSNPTNDRSSGTRASRQRAVDAQRAYSGKGATLARREVPGSDGHNGVTLRERRAQGPQTT